MRHCQFDQRPRRSRLTVAAITAIGTATGLTPCAARFLAVTPIKTNEPRCARTTASINGQLRCVQCLDLQIKAAPGSSGLLVGPG
ncbi:hypothetical protein D9M69_574030 [compost metagenome]